MAKLPFLLFRSLRLSHNSTCLCIEKCVRQSAYKDLIEGIELAMLEVTQKDIRNWFTHCCYCTS